MSHKTGHFFLFSFFIHLAHFLDFGVEILVYVVHKLHQSLSWLLLSPELHLSFLELIDEVGKRELPAAKD